MMDGIRVGKRVVGTQSPVTIGWENIPKVEGGPFKRLFFTWFQPVAFFAMIAFWYYAPNSIAKASGVRSATHPLTVSAQGKGRNRCQANAGITSFINSSSERFCSASPSPRLA